MLSLSGLKYLTGLRLGLCVKHLILFKHLSLNFPLRLTLLDLISANLCLLNDRLLAFRHLLAAQTDKNEEKNRFQSQLQISLSQVDDFMRRLNEDRQLYNVLLEIKYHEQGQLLDRGQQEFLDQMIRDFEVKYAVGRDGKQQELLMREEELKELLEVNIRENKENLVFSSDFTNVLKPLARRTRLFSFENGRNFEFKGHFRQVLWVIKEMNDRKLKNVLWKAYFSANKKNTSVIKELLITRGRYLKEIGFKGSFAEFSLRNCSLTGKVFLFPVLTEFLLKESLVLREEIRLLSPETQIQGNTLAYLLDLLLNDHEKEPMREDLATGLDKICRFFSEEVGLKLEWAWGKHEEVFPSIRIQVIESNNSMGSIVIPMIRGGVTHTMILRSNQLVNQLIGSRSKPEMLILVDFRLDSGSISPIEAKTMVHEISHAVHNILSLHDFQFISNNTALDYAETTAVIIENHFQALRNADNSLEMEQQSLETSNVSLEKEEQKNRENINNSLEKEEKSLKYFNNNSIEKNGKTVKYSNNYSLENRQKKLKEAMERLEQLYFSLVDLSFHHTGRNDLSEETLQKLNKKAFVGVFGDLDHCEEFSNNNYYCSMGHLASYPGLYYSYSLGHSFYAALRERSSREEKRSFMNRLVRLGHDSSAFYLMLKELTA